MNNSERIFSDNAKTLLNERYLLDITDPATGEVRKETWNELCMRTAIAIAKASIPYNDRNYEEEVKEYYDAIRTLGFIPATPILMNAGTEKQQLFSCFVTQLQDNLKSIYAELGLSAEIFAGAGGVGYDFGELRPEGSKVAGRGISSGALSFMKLYDTSCGIIKIGSGSRRGAMLAALPVDHPEILEFIKCKQNGKDFKNFNVSVVITDDFMAAVKMDGEYELKAFKNNPERKTLKARKVFNAIVNQAWKTGEPGILFLDTANRFNPTPKLGRYRSSNPCFSGDMRLLTVNGYKSFEELCDKEVRLINMNGDESNGKVWYSGEKETITLTLSNFRNIICTPNHKFITSDGCKHEAKDLKGKKPMYFYKPKQLSSLDTLYVKLGFIQGDGNLTRLNSPEHAGLEINIGKNDKDIQSFFGYKDSDFNKDGRKVYTTEFNVILKKLGFIAKVLPERSLPTTINTWTDEQVSSFLCGLASANGHAGLSSGCVKIISTTCKKLAEQVQSLVKERFNIVTSMETRPSKLCTFSNGTYLCKENYHLNIRASDGFENLIRFSEKINFIIEYKREALAKLIQKRMPKVIKIKESGIKKVYDYNEPLVNFGVVEGVIASNCGEVVGIDGSVCCLGHVNFATIVKDGKIDYAELERRIRLGIRFLDNCIDVNKYPHDKFKKISLATRTIGLGFAGFADMLAQMNIRYGSDECLKLIDEIGSKFQEISHDESFQIALKRGNYPAFENKTPLRRNASTNTVAPTGSTAMIADCSYGVEPYFAIAFIKNCMDGVQMKYGNKYFEAYLNTLSPDVKEEVLSHAQKYGTIRNIDKKLLPDYIIDTFVTAHDISPKERVMVQATWQKYIDLSISSTVNMPEDSKKEDVAQIYTLAWEQGCKGITVYRSNSRKEQVLNIGAVNTNTYTCEMCGTIHHLEEGLDPSQVCIKCNCGHRSCA